jgi:hypothetical protein
VRSADALRELRFFEFKAERVGCDVREIGEALYHTQDEEHAGVDAH